MKIFYVIILICTLFSSCHQKATKKHKKAHTLATYSKIGSLHVKLGRPEPGDWLYHHKEKGQAYNDYKKRKKICPNDTMTKISILPLGNFSDIEWQLLQKTAGYVSKFFMFDVVLSGSVSDKSIPKKSRRGQLPFEQLHTRFILDSVLYPNIPDSSISYICLTNKDLYPQESWNFVFGQASLTKRIGVSSFFRYYDEEIDSSNFNIVLKRTIKTTTHELCHMFTLKHCRIYKCLLNGSNSMIEADNKPVWLCPECLAKLQYCLGFDNLERFDALIAFYKGLNMDKEATYYTMAKSLIQTKE